MMRRRKTIDVLVCTQKYERREEKRRRSIREERRQPGGQEINS